MEPKERRDQKDQKDRRLQQLLETYVDRHLATGFPPDLRVLCEADAEPELLSELARLVSNYHRLDGSFGMPAKDLSGRPLGSFRLLRLLARGYVSEIYLALDIRGGKRVALKVFPGHLLIDPREPLEDQRTEHRRVIFESTFPMLASQGDNTLPTLFEVGQEQGLAYISMEWFDGGVFAPAADPLERRADLVKILSCLAEVHGRGLVVGDLRPGCILKAGSEIRLLVWGVSTIGLGHRELSTSLAGLFDLAFAAPEQLTGASCSASDVFSSATMIAFAVLGRSPFEASTRQEVAALLEQAGAGMALDGVVPGLISPPLRDLLEACWNRDPGARPTIAELLRRLESGAL